MEKDNTNTILILAAVGAAAYAVYRLSKSDIVEGTGSAITGAGAAITGIGDVVGGAGSGIGADLKTAGETLSATAPYIEKSVGIQPFQTLRGLEEATPLAPSLGEASPLIMGGTPLIGIGGGGLGIDVTPTLWGGLKKALPFVAPLPYAAYKALKGSTAPQAGFNAPEAVTAPVVAAQPKAAATKPISTQKVSSTGTIKTDVGEVKTAYKSNKPIYKVKLSTGGYAYTPYKPK